MVALAEVVEVMFMQQILVSSLSVTDFIILLYDVLYATISLHKTEGHGDIKSPDGLYELYVDYVPNKLARTTRIIFENTRTN